VFTTGRICGPTVSEYSVVTMSERPDSWERVPTEDYDDVAEALADMTGRPKEDFEPDYDEYPMPDPEDLERVPIDDFECPCGCTDE